MSLNLEETYDLAMFILTNGQEGYLPASSPAAPASPQLCRRSPGSDYETATYPSPSEFRSSSSPIVNASTSYIQPATGTASYTPRTPPIAPFLPPPAPLLGKRRRVVDTPPSSSAEASRAPMRAANTQLMDSNIACLFTDCSFKGSAHYLWLHIKVAHGGRGEPRSADSVSCGWGWCPALGTPEEIVAHFRAVHNSEYDSDGVVGVKTDVCGVAWCGMRVAHGEEFRQHVFGEHWHLPPYYNWCETCGSFVQKYDARKAKEHAAACLTKWMVVHFLGWSR